MPAKKTTRKKKTASKKAAASAGSDQLYLFYGTDEAKVKEAALKLSQKIAPKDDEFGLEIVNGAAENSDHATRILAQAHEAIQTIPFFGGDKVVWLQSTNIFGTNQTAKSETTLKAVESFSEQLQTTIPPDVKVIISAVEMDKSRRFFKQISKFATTQAFDKVDISKDGWEAQVMAVVSKRAEKMGLTFGYGVLDRFVMTAGADTSVLNSELEKLSLYCGSREVTEQDVIDMVTATHAGVIFEIGEAITRKDLPRTLDLIERQLRRGEGPIGILRAAIIPKIRGLLHAKDLVTRHNLSVGRNFRSFEADVARLPEAETAHLPRKKDGNLSVYPIFLSAQATRKFSVPELVQALEACLEADLRLVTTQLDHRLVLCQLVTKILA